MSTLTVRLPDDKAQSIMKALAAHKKVELKQINEGVVYHKRGKI